MKLNETYEQSANKYGESQQRVGGMYLPLQTQHSNGLHWNKESSQS